MGLDMYLVGEKYFTLFHGIARQLDEGFEVSEYLLNLGYWRKHPNLHGYIVENFANGDDECQRIYLSPENLLQIIAAVEADDLPHTEGFFFGESDLSRNQKDADTTIFRSAYSWLLKDIEGVWKSIYYQASW